VVQVWFLRELVCTSLFNLLKASIHLSFKAHVKHAVSLINNQVLKFFQLDVLSVLEMVQKSAWRAHQDSAAFA